MHVNLRDLATCDGGLHSLRNRNRTMKVFFALLVAVLLGVLPAAFAKSGRPVQAESASRFQVDAPLSREMAALRAAFAARLPAIQAGRLDAAGYARLGMEVDARVATIIRECRLPSDADAVLHGYLGRMLGAATRMRNADADPSARHDAALEVVAAYNAYGSRFADPAWRALEP